MTQTKIKYEISDITKLVKNLDIMETTYNIISLLKISHKKAVYIVKNNFGDNFILKVKLKDFVKDDELIVYKYIKKNPHKNVNKIIHIFETKKLIILILEYIDGNSLSFLTNENDYDYIYNNKLDMIFEQTSHGLSHLHSLGIIHGDIKSSHIYIENKTFRPILIDFDFAKKISTNKLSKLSKNMNKFIIIHSKKNNFFTKIKPVGTKGFIAPECYSGILNKKSDIWGLAMSFYIFIFRNTIFEKNINNDDEIFKYYDPHTLLLYNGKHKKITEIIEKMLTTNHEYRPNIDQVICMINNSN
jgi:serine/threonine protein kinase